MSKYYTLCLVGQQGHSIFLPVTQLNVFGFTHLVNCTSNLLFSMQSCNEKLKEKGWKEVALILIQLMCQKQLPSSKFNCTNMSAKSQPKAYTIFNGTGQPTNVLLTLISITLGIIGISFRFHLGWKPIPKNPIPISSATALTCSIKSCKEDCQVQKNFSLI